MLIDLKTIANRPGHFHFILPVGWWQDDEHNQAVKFASPLQVNVDISRAGSNYILEGNLSGILKLTCSRCVEFFPNEISSDFNIILSALPDSNVEDDIELDEKDMQVDFFSGDEIDLDDIIRSQIYLTLPMKPLCGNDCNGLCPVCGTNLNIKKCNCTNRKGHPEFLKLQALKEK